MVVLRSLVAACFCLAAATQVWSQTEVYYRSNAAGMAISRIDRGSIDRYEYVLVSSQSGGELVERLLRNGTETSVRMTEEVGGERTVTELEDGIISGRSVYRDGVPVTEEIYREGERTQRIEYRYDDEGVLQTRSIYDAAGEVLERRNYRYGPDGRLIRVEHVAEGLGRTTIYRFGGAGLYESWLGAEGSRGLREPDRGTLYRYQDGDITDVERWSGDRLLEIEQVIDTGSGRVRTTKNLAEDREVIERYDGAGNIVERTVTVGDTRIETTRYAYEDGLMVESITVSGGQSEERRYRYDEAGERSEMTVLRNGVVAKVVVWTGETNRYEDVYRDGSPVLRVYFEDDKKVSEEMLE